MLLYGIVLFFNYPVNMMMRLSKPLSYSTEGLTPAEIELARVRMLRLNLNAVFEDSGSLILFLLVVMAIFSAVMLFSYLSNHTQVDFYHSQPVKRTQLFGIRFATGIAYFLIPLAFNLAVCILVALFSGNLFLLSFTQLSLCFGSVLLEYFAVFSISVFVGMLCGTVVAHVLSSAISLVLLPAILFLPQLVFDCFYKTYYTPFPFLEVASFLSPAFAFASSSLDTGM